MKRGINSLRDLFLLRVSVVSFFSTLTFLHKEERMRVQTLSQHPRSWARRAASKTNCVR